MTTKRVSCFAYRQAYCTSVTGAGRKMTSLHVRFHCVEIVPVPAAERTGISCLIFSAVLSSDLVPVSYNTQTDS